MEKIITLKLLALLLAMCFIQINAQDSLYLNYTITGDNTHILSYAKGVGDVNGDGYTDLIVGFSGTAENPEAYSLLYLGNSPFDTIPDYIFPSSFFIELGDINNDTFDDILATAYSGDHVKMKIYLGSSDLDTLLSFSFNSQYLDEVLTSNIEPIGDLNNDGYCDIAIGAPYNWSNGMGHVYLFWGGDTITSEPNLILQGTLVGDHFGASICGIGDINNDEIYDIAVGAPEPLVDNDSGCVYIFYGSENMDNIYDKKFNDGDINFSKRIYKNTSTNYSILGLNKIFFYQKDSLLYSIDGGKYGFGGNVSLGIGGDINKDGFNDYLIGNTNYRNTDEVMVGGVFGFLGTEQADTLEDFIFEGEHKWSEFGKEIDIAGDINGDLYDDIIIVSPSFSNSGSVDEEIGKLYIYSQKKISGLNKKTHSYPKDYQLFQNYPNPFNPTTTISFYLPKMETISLEIYDLSGRKVKSLINNKRETVGRHEVIWNGKNDAGVELSSGLYIYVLKSELHTISRKLLFLK